MVTESAPKIVYPRGPGDQLFDETMALREQLEEEGNILGLALHEPVTTVEPVIPADTDIRPRLRYLHQPDDDLATTASENAPWPEA